MALRGDYLTVRVPTTGTGSGSASAIIAESTSVNVDFSADALETTSQTSGLNAAFIGGKVTCTVSGDYLVASDSSEFANLFTQMNAGTVIEVEVYNDSTLILEGDGVITSLGIAGGNSDTLFTGSYSIQCSGDMAT